MAGIEFSIVERYFKNDNNVKYSEFSKFIDIVVQHPYGSHPRIEDMKDSVSKIKSILKDKSVADIVNVAYGILHMKKKFRNDSIFRYFLEEMYTYIPKEHIDKFVDPTILNNLDEHETPQLVNYVLDRNLCEYESKKVENNVVPDSEVIKLQQKNEELQKTIDDYNKKMTIMKQLVEPKQ